MANRKKRSRFWVVSTHVLTTGFAMPFLASLVAGFLGGYLEGIYRTGGILATIVTLVLMTIGYAGGTLYSLSYIRRKAIVENPRGCIWPSIIAFALLTCGWGAASLFMGQTGPVAAVIIGVYFLAIIICFSLLTRRGFNQMAAQTAEQTEE